MAVSAPSYLRLSRHNVFYFRWPVPAALHPQGKVQHVETSLRTRNPRLALQIARYLAYHAENITGHLMGMRHSQIKAELQAFFADKLADFKARRENSGGLPKWMEDQYARFLRTIEQANSDGINERIFFASSQDIQKQINEVLQIRQMPVTEDTPEYEMLSREYPLAYAQYLRDILSYNNDLKDYSLSPTQQSIPIQTKAIGMTLKQAVADFVAERERGEAWTDRTLKDRVAQLTLLCELLDENIDIANLDSSKAAEVKKTLQALPKNRNKNPKTRGKPVSEMLKVEDVERMDTKTVNEYLTVYQSFFGWAERQGHVQKNFFNGLQIKLGKRKANARVPFSRDQIKTILDALPEHTPEKSGKSFRYWGVMLAIYTGARLNEIAQLALDDIQQENSIWYLNITDEGEDDNKRLKNDNSKRRVPVHAALIACGFIDHMQALKTAGHSRLFPDLEHQQGHGYGRGLTRWVNTKLLVDLDIKDDGLSFHSFRHSFITGLRHAGVELPTVQELVGHSKEVVTETVYNATAYPLPLLKTAIDKLAYA
ncbi:MAG: site-specific integrase [Micavibrio sp.]|nr:site-specific integrase [Micavibrio sp.]